MKSYILYHFVFRMDVVVASSRGFELEEGLKKEFKDIFPPGTLIKAITGGKLKHLTPLAKELTPSYTHSKRPHIYFVCGVPDISEIVRSPNKTHYFYKEVIYVEEPEKTIERVKELLDTTQRDIIKHGALPVFSTIPQFNIEIYNNHMLTCKKPKTKHLHHTKTDYDTMQKNLMQSIDQINGYISHINKKVGASTPFLHDTVKESRARKGSKYYAYKWKRYRDGLHAGEYLTKTWAQVLSNTMRINRAKEDSDDEGSPKRAWKKTRFDI